MRMTVSGPPGSLMLFQALSSVKVKVNALMKERLQKFLSRAGVASRRQAEEYIKAGLVTVNGQRAEIGAQIDPGVDEIRLRGELVRPAPRKVYYMLNKPPGVVTTVHDTHGRQTVLDLLEGVSERVYPVGRLDLDTQGLLLLTNDGDFAYRLTHPKYRVPKTYRAWVKGVPSEQELHQLRAGVMLEDGLTAPAEVKQLEARSGCSLLEIVIHEGRKRQVKRMCQAIGHPVLQLQRMAFGNLQLGGLQLGAWRPLTVSEIRNLWHLAGVRDSQ
jgi:23S rRNA pseudouridine2605 synthase